MDDSIQTFPWKDGYWVSKVEKSGFTSRILGNTIFYFNRYEELDNPDSGSKPVVKDEGKLYFGQFDPTPEELKSVTNIENYNLKIAKNFEGHVKTGQ